MGEVKGMENRVRNTKNISRKARVMVSKSYYPKIITEIHSIDLALSFLAAKVKIR